MDSTNALRRRSTLVYDGHCSFCRRWVDRIARRDRSGTFEFVARQTEGLTKRFPKLIEGDFNTGMRLITLDGTVHVGADAAYQIVRHLRYWRRIACLYHVPGIHWLTQQTGIKRTQSMLCGYVESCEDVFPGVPTGSGSEQQFGRHQL